MKKFLIALSCLVAILVVGIGCEDMKKNENIVKLIGVETRKVVDKNTEEIIVSKIKEVKLGDDLQKVITLFGTPTFSEGAADKKTGDLKMIIIKYYFSTKYYFSSNLESLSSERIYLTLYFNNQGILEDAYTNSSILRIDHLVKKNK